MRRSISADLLIGSLLVFVGVTLRMMFVEIPNFAPVAALALLSGYVLRSRLVAMGVPLLVMGFSDLRLGGHNLAVMFSVYAMLALPALIGRPLRRHAQIRSLRSLNTWKSLLALTSCGLVASCLFFLVTNFACWRFSGWYEQTWLGLWNCFLLALPFFRYTLAGDFVFTIGFFTVYAAWGSLSSRLSLVSAARPAAAP